MIVVRQGAVVEACGRPGEFVFDSSTEPSLFFGEGGSMGERIRASFERVGTRFSFGGDTGKDQRVYFFNAKEIVGNKLQDGGAGALPRGRQQHWTGRGHLRALQRRTRTGLSDPLMFYKNVCGNVEAALRARQNRLTAQERLLTALQPAFARISA